MQIFADQGLVFRARAGLVDILDPQQELTRIGQLCGSQGREGMAQMQRTGGRRGKPRSVQLCSTSHC